MIHASLRSTRGRTGASDKAEDSVGESSSGVSLRTATGAVARVSQECHGRERLFHQLALCTRWVMERLVKAFRQGGDPNKQKGALGYVLAWLLGVPIPILIIVALLRGCA